MTADRDTTLEYISQITMLNDLHGCMQDEQLDRAMELCIKLTINLGAVPPGRVPELIVELQAISMQMALKSVHCATFVKAKAGDPGYGHKNVFYTARESIDRLVDALKYLAKSGVA
jgi:hypothetical protein